VPDDPRSAGAQLRQSTAHRPNPDVQVEVLLLVRPRRIACAAARPSALREQPREVRTRWELPADPTTPRRARELLELRLASWSWPASGRNDVDAVLNELVTKRGAARATLPATERQLETVLDAQPRPCAVVLDAL
jgi:hypothetical protein